jgi:hypothetical protein
VPLSCLIEGVDDWGLAAQLQAVRPTPAWWLTHSALQMAGVADAAELVAEAELQSCAPRSHGWSHPQKVCGYARTDLDSMQDCRGRLRADLGLERERRGRSPGTIARGWMARGRRERGGPRLVGEPERGAKMERLGGAVNDAEHRAHQRPTCSAWAQQVSECVHRDCGQDESTGERAFVQCVRETPGNPTPNDRALHPGSACTQSKRLRVVDPVTTNGCRPARSGRVSEGTTCRTHM